MGKQTEFVEVKLLRAWAGHRAGATVSLLRDKAKWIVEREIGELVDEKEYKAIFKPKRNKAIRSPKPAPVMEDTSFVEHK